MSTITEAPLDPALNESMAAIPIAVVTVTLSIATLAVSLRVYARAGMIHQFGLDDWAAILALILAISSGTMVAVNTIYGHGRHLAAVLAEDPGMIPKYFRTFYISIVLYNGSLTATKLTFLLQYYRILGTGYMKKVILAAGVFVALWSISQLLVVIFTCSPIHKFWLPETPGRCIPNIPFWYYNAAGNILTDVIIFVLPLPVLTRLNLRKNQKLGLIGVFSLGFFTCAISVIRIQYLKLSDDVTWDNVASSCWSISELCSGITCACLPTLRPLLSRFIPGMGSQHSNSRSKYYRRSSGRNLSNGSRVKSADEDGSSRGIMYPEDLELQSDDRSDKEIRVAASPPGSSSQCHDNSNNSKHARRMDKLRLGLKPTVRTEIRVGPAVPQTSWQRRSNRGIEVKRDFILTSLDRDREEGS
ncbi:hypothetical protein VTK26DRAFT_2018 [Humicola hyalothermophila]